MKKMRMRLRYVAECSFNASEATNFYGVVPKSVRSQMRGNDVACLVSKTGNQLCFVYSDKKTGPATALASARLRLSGRAPWNPLMLADYANAVGIELEGIKKLEQHLEKR